jgi:hypothetical protein
MSLRVSAGAVRRVLSTSRVAGAPESGVEAARGRTGGKLEYCGMAGVPESSWIWDRTGGKLEGLGRPRARGATTAVPSVGPLSLVCVPCVLWKRRLLCGMLLAVQTYCLIKFS